MTADDETRHPARMSPLRSAFRQILSAKARTQPASSLVGPGAGTPILGRRAPRCVWLGWLLLTGAAFWFVAKFSGNVPLWDEWLLVPVLTHEQPITWSWLWSQHNEHRIPLPRLIHIGLARISNTDFRAGAFLNVALISALSAQLVLAARRLRGCYRFTDLALPLALLHWGNYDNLLWSFQVPFSTSTWLTTTLLILIAGSRGKLTAVQSWCAGAMLFALSLCGAQGAPVVLLTTAWLAWGEISDARLNGKRLAVRLGRLALPALACAVVGCCFLNGCQAPPQNPHAGGWKALRAALEFFAAGLGQATVSVWPFFSIVMLALCGVVFAALLRAWKTGPADRYAIGGLLLFMAGMLVLAAAIGMARGLYGSGAGATPRYSWLAAPVCCWAYLAATRFMRPAVAARVQGCLLLCLTVLVVENSRLGLVWAAERRQTMEALERDVSDGVPCERLEHKYFSRLACTAGNLELLRRAGAGPYRGEGRLIPQQNLRYPMFVTQPRSVDSFAPTEVECEGQLCLAVHSPGTVTFDLAPGLRQLDGRFGVDPRADLSPQPDGTEFVVLWVKPGGQSNVLWRKRLDPGRMAADRGMHDLHVDLPESPPGSWLELKTTCAPKTIDRPDQGWRVDWSYWTGLRLQ
jgi:hypothetical protein